MIRDVLKARLDQYAPQNALEQENALQEIMQHYVLVSLSRNRLFTEAVFHGGTCLRIFHALQRFSEDLDFLLKAPDTGFKWNTYLDGILSDCRDEGIDAEAVDRSSADTVVKKAFIKTDTPGSILLLDIPFERHSRRKLKIKLEVDTNPPAGSTVETMYLTFPRPAPVTVQALASGFGLKLHALLCRAYVKGRDWYDFLWYLARGIEPDLHVLSNALAQQGPWAQMQPEVTTSWLVERMAERIQTLDWTRAREDVQRFLPRSEQDGLLHWGQDLFLQQLQKLTTR